MPPPPAPRVSVAMRILRVVPWLLVGGGAAVSLWSAQQRIIAEDALAAERLRCDAIESDMMAERLADRRQCSVDKDVLEADHRNALTTLQAAYAERERILVEKTRLDVEKARIAGAEQVLQASSSTDPNVNPMLVEMRRLREEIEARQSELAQADAQLRAATEEIERLGQEKRKLARALDSANLAVAEAEQARADATREVQGAKERAVELEWNRFELTTIQELCWDGLKRRRDTCKEDVSRALLQAKVEWLVCRLEEGARPTVTVASATRPPTAGARLLLEQGERSAWLVLCDHSLRDALGTP